MTTQLSICLVLFLLLIVGFLQTKISRPTVALLIMMALVFTGCLEAKTALSGFGNATTILIASMFVVSAAFGKTQLVNKISQLVSKVSKGSFTMVLAGYVLITFLLAQVTGGSAACFSVIFPLAIAVCDELGYERSKMMFPLGFISICTVLTLPLGGNLTTMATFNGYLEAYGISGFAMGPMDLFKARAPIAILMVLYAIFLAPKFCPSASESDAEVKTRKREQAQLSSIQETFCYIAFFGTIILMMLSSKIGIAAWEISLTGALITVAAGVLSTKEAYNAATQHGVIMQYVGVIAMASALSNTGAADLVGGMIANMIGGTHNNLVICFVFFAVPFVLTQFMNNRSVDAIFVPIAAMTCGAMGCNPIGPMILSTCAALTSFVTPMSTATVNMYMGLGNYSQKDLIKMSWVPALISLILYPLWISIIFPPFN